MSPKSGRGPVSTDPVEIFAVLMHFGGDVFRTSLALRLDESVVSDLVRRHNWAAKLTKYSGCRDVESLGEARTVQQQINRGVIYICARRLLAVLDELIYRMSQDPKLVTAMTTVTSTHGTRRDFRALVDLGKALNTVVNITFRVLGDDQARGGKKRERPEPDSALSRAADAAMDAADQHATPDSHETLRTHTPAREDCAR